MSQLSDNTNETLLLGMGLLLSMLSHQYNQRGYYQEYLTDHSRTTTTAKDEGHYPKERQLILTQRTTPPTPITRI